MCGAGRRESLEMKCEGSHQDDMKPILGDYVITVGAGQVQVPW